PRLVGRLKAVEQSLTRRDAVAVRSDCPDDRLVGARSRYRRLAENAPILLAERRARGDLRPISSERLGNAFISRAYRGAVRFERRVVLVGLHERGSGGLRWDRR